jgi:glyoxylase-like metal-dependent hydrolase (beta-lactamase superfamily II)
LAEILMSAPASGAKVRMYRQGLGDCFLLAFATGAGRPFYMLIDCGVLMGTEDAAGKLRRVAESLRDSTGGRIDVLVATHQHWDHLSGFDQAREVFDQIDFGEVWVGWTEDPANELAGRLRARRRSHLRALAGAARSLRAAGGEGKAGDLEAVLGFFGDLGADGRPSRIEGALDYVLGRGRPPRYRTPGEVIGLPGAAVRVYVLGPPQDEGLLLRSDPSRRASEVYEQRLRLSQEDAFFAAVLAAAPSESSLERDILNLSFPFEEVYRAAYETARADPFFQEHYFGAAGEENAAGWRQVEGDWLGAAGTLALQLDSDTNNTSLALAIELSPGGKVLLFPGDAQVGNWLSWHDLRWPREGSEAFGAADLLRRTALYKVGHHASHNATLREKGLELMERPDLVAMIPVDERMAHRPKGGNPDGWDMPFAPLLERLTAKTRGRVLRADTGAPAPEELADPADREAFAPARIETPLYLEITISA